MDALRLLDEGISLATKGRLEDAVERLKLAAQMGPTSVGVCVHLGRAYFRLHQMDEALIAFRAAVRINPDSPAARKWLGVTLLASERPKDAVAELEMAVELDPEVASTYLGLCSAYRAVGRHQAAEKALKKARRLNPEIDNDMAVMVLKVGMETQEAQMSANFWWQVAAERVDRRSD